jgi:hypothetical protein
MAPTHGSNQALGSLVNSLSDSKRTSDANSNSPKKPATGSRRTTNEPRVDRIRRREQRDLTPEETDEMDKFFIRMQAIYRHLWSSSFEGEAMMRQAQKEWLDTFYRANLTGKQISEGLVRCKQTFSMPPSPKEFLDLLPSRRQDHQIARRALPEPDDVKAARCERGMQKMKNIKALLNSTKPTEEAPDE